ncbi:MAG TPA: hypothetical protein VGG25_06890, partial [Streptosporangiaceae bacterium]
MPRPGSWASTARAAASAPECHLPGRGAGRPRGAGPGGRPVAAVGRALLYAAGAGVASIIALACGYYATARGPMIVIAPVAALGVALPVTAGLLRGNSIGLAGVLGM